MAGGRVDQMGQYIVARDQMRLVEVQQNEDGGLAAHFEHSIAILKDRTEIMTRSWDDPDFDPATFSLK